MSLEYLIVHNRIEESTSKRTNVTWLINSLLRAIWLNKNLEILKIFKNMLMRNDLTRTTIGLKAMAVLLVLEVQKIQIMKKKKKKLQQLLLISKRCRV